MQEIEQILEKLEEKKCLDIVKTEVDPVEITIHREQYKGLRVAEDIIRKHADSGWIPVKKRSPENRGLYLCTAECEGERYVIVGHYNGPGWTEDYAGQKVIAWQQLPEPYSEDAEGV